MANPPPAIFGQWLCDIAAKDERVVGITLPCAKVSVW